MSIPGAFLSIESGERTQLEGEVIVGRADDATLTLALPRISRHHARLQQRSGSWWVRDLDSKNGTFVNGEDVSGAAVRLVDGDQIVFAGAVTASFHDPAATPMAPRIGRLDGVWIDPSTNAVWVDATRIEPPLSAKQLQLLMLLDTRGGEIVSRPDIVAHVWADEAAAGVSDDAVSALVKRLRARLREGPRQLDYVEVVKGRGIRLTSS